jgi:hypothetical protein
MLVPPTWWPGASPTSNAVSAATARDASGCHTLESVGFTVTYAAPSLLDTSGVGGDAVEHILGLDDAGVRVQPVAYGSADAWYVVYTTPC